MLKEVKYTDKEPEITDGFRVADGAIIFGFAIPGNSVLKLRRYAQFADIVDKSRGNPPQITNVRSPGIHWPGKNFIG